MSAEEKPLCKFGANCYRKNPDHLKKFRHPKRKHDSGDAVQEEKKVKKGTPQDKNKKTIQDFFGKKGEEKNKKDEDPRTSPSEDEVDKEEEKRVSDEEQKHTEHETSEEESEDDDTEGPSSPDSVRDNIKQKFLVEMPEDFYDFWEFCCHLDKKNPRDALAASLGYQLVGPYDIMAGRQKGVKKNKHGRKPNYLLHWRYFYDPPEFMTVIKGDNKTQFHLGYLRDDPSEMPCMVAANSATESCVLSPKGDNLFAAVKNCIEDQLKNKSLDSSKKKGLQSLKEDLEEWASKKNLCLDLKSKKMKERDKKVVCKTFHMAGLVVPVDANDVGYRPVPETPGDLKKMMKKVVTSKTDKERDEGMDEIQELITLVQFANDECDYGEGLELGMDLFCYGSDVFHPMIEHLLPLAYQLLGRIEYEQIIKAHLKHRQKGADLSQID